jgi:hypothetical protein
VKNVLLAAANARIPFLSDTYEGSCHDKPIAEVTPYPLAEGSELLQDLGFVGFTLAGVQITQPHKKPRGQDLTDEQKAENRVIAQRRVLVEHIICSIKRCRIVKDTIRLWKIPLVTWSWPCAAVYTTFGSVCVHGHLSLNKS